MGKKLGFHTPFSIAYQHHGFQTGILLANVDCREWLYSRYIQIYLSVKSELLEYDVSHLFDDDMTFVKCFRSYPIEYIDGMDVVNDVMAILERGEYVIGFWDEYYVKNKQAYKKRKFSHNYIIVGYDEEEKRFFSAGYVGDRHWKEFDVGFSEFNEAVKANYDHYAHIESLAPNKYFQWRFEYDQFVDKLDGYIQSRSDRVELEPSDCQRGLDACRAYFNKMREWSEDKKRIPLESTYLMKEHKSIMLERMHFLKERAIVEVPEETVNAYRELVTEYEKILNMLIMYNMSKKPNLGKKLCDAGEACLKAEEKVLVDWRKKL